MDIVYLIFAILGLVAFYYIIRHATHSSEKLSEMKKQTQLMRMIATKLGIEDSAINAHIAQNENPFPLKWD